MSVLGIQRLIGIFVVLATLLIASGRGDLVWTGIAHLRYHALKSAHKPWGCPSTTKGACSSYDPSRYK